jgi:hypothetical protein
MKIKLAILLLILGLLASCGTRGAYQLDRSEQYRKAVCARKDVTCEEWE